MIAPSQHQPPGPHGPETHYDPIDLTTPEPELGPQPEPPPAADEMIHCSACAETKSKVTFFTMTDDERVCEHLRFCCKECVSRAVKSAIDNGKIDQHGLKCPYRCNYSLSVDNVRENMTAAQFAEYAEALTKHFLANNDSYKRCLSSNCGHTFSIEGRLPENIKKIGESSSFKLQCPHCDYQFCHACGRAWESHTLETCKKIQLEEEQARIVASRELGFKSCPNCNVQIEKVAGCDHMTCGRCQHEFCWICLFPWKGHCYSRHADDRDHAAEYRGEYVANNLANPGNRGREPVRARIIQLRTRVVNVAE
ncbi:hypothetical protein NX059_012397 [Plenodomus lindquistii]|nr:hypothetical protein NX059_012397 [Plenodomus lindquistii]